ncbi:MAG TPA: hypothetical protein VH475_15840 [Tepidisphaeraceae bacterium]
MILTRAFSPLLASLILIGCAPKQETTLKGPPPEPNPQPQLATDVRARVQQLGGVAEQYASLTAKLPGATEQEDRQWVAQAFTQLSQILPMLNGPDMPGDLQQQMRIIESTRSLLSSGSTDLSVEPTIDTGLRAAQRALSSIRQRAFPEQNQAAKDLDAMRSRVQELDTVQGALHRLVAAEALQGSARAVTGMSNSLNQRLAVDQPAGSDHATAAAPPSQPPGQPKNEQPASASQPPQVSTPAAPKTEQPGASKTEPSTAQPQPQPQQTAQPAPSEKPAQPAKPPVELNK